MVLNFQLQEPTKVFVSLPQLLLSIWGKEEQTKGTDIAFLCVAIFFFFFFFFFFKTEAVQSGVGHL